MFDLDTSGWGARNAHDPTIVRGDDGLWYMFSTDAAAGVDRIPAGAHVRTSPDLVTWTFRGTALDGVPQQAGEWSGAAGLWAPEVVRWPDAGGDERDAEPRWHMYYSASTFGSRTSAIGLATASAPSGPWTDRGIVIATHHDRDAVNAIDAAVVFDADGAPWMIYGSFFGGIHAVELSIETGKRLRDEPGALIARRPRSVDGAIEGAYVVRRDGRYVLFVSYDSLADTYSVRVGVSDAITGPYLDHQGRELTSPAEADAESTGTKVLGGLRFPGGVGLIAPGHNSIFHDGDATFMVHHVRLADAPTQHEAQVRRVHWTASGWPLVSPHPYAGAERERLASPEPIAGEWDAVRFAPEVPAMVDAERVTVIAEGESDGDAVGVQLVVCPDAGSLNAAQAGSLRLSKGPSADIVLDAVVFGAWDPVAQRTVLAFSGIDRDGVVWSGSKAVTP
ncbi:arabinan endo-1,5-alpha-L-arabinosidase [Microbacterium sp. YJN-G]|uniref:arabinan endo-1,5-alpha-L-arabinosidase n=1 Tax=Microbacterium sp. YJN-G TaxID=2763257 RepID=UPI0018785AAF|nr:arabinan endo-1,5-alpha-L-arabinosidase [Microbacterium sp. YJN-G]